MSNIRQKMPTSYTSAGHMLDGRTERAIAHNTRLRAVDHGDGHGVSFDLIYHATVIARFTSDGYVSLNSGGYWTSTTKDRLSGVLRHEPYRVFQKDFAWYLDSPVEGVTPWEDWVRIPLS